jgi:Holliday junction DNA helicase RuvA
LTNKEPDLLKGKKLIAYLEGKLIEKNPTHLILEVNGVGYSINIPVSSYADIGEIGRIVKVLTYQYVREDELRLYGFSSRQEKELFELLISINGVGPRLALGILSSISVEDFQRSILGEDLDVLTHVSGVGKKTAQRLIVELKEKLGKVDLGVEKGIEVKEKIGAPVEEEAVLALVSLGYNKFDARKAVQKVNSETEESLPIEELIKRALKHAK